MSNTILLAVVSMVILPFVVRLFTGSDKAALLTILATIVYLYFHASR